MSSVNKLILIGNLGGDPETKSVGDTTVTNFSLATNESWTGRDGQKQERVEWTPCVVWGKLGEVCAKYLTKGRQVYIEGRKQTRSWEDKETKKKMYMTECVVSNVVFLQEGNKENRDRSEPSGGSNDGGGFGGGYSGGHGDDLPF